MTLYRALRKLSIGVAAGGIFNGDILKPDNRSILENKGLIAPVKAPAIADVWPNRVDALFNAGFNCFSELILAHNLTGELRAWQAEAVKLLSPGIEQGCGCRRNKKENNNG